MVSQAGDTTRGEGRGREPADSTVFGRIEEQHLTDHEFRDRGELTHPKGAQPLR